MPSKFPPSSAPAFLVGFSLFLTTVLPAVVAASETRLPEPSRSPSATYREPYRPQFHFSAARHWMNDPNGLVYINGEYHLFYQHNPFGDRWGHMSWGHAVSRNLVHWEHLPVALPEHEHFMIFSGSAVLDRDNTSGFGTNRQPPLVAIYTGHYKATGKQAQHLAYSIDGGRSWQQYSGNPVLDIGARDFRDPKVIWHAPERKWVMVVSMAAERKVRFSASRDLKQWELLSEFGPAGAVDGVWECPDLFPLCVDDQPSDVRWLLKVDLNPGGPTGGSGSQYFVGYFDGRRFLPEEPVALGALSARWVDHGPDFYASISWFGTPEETRHRVWAGWMNNWLYAEALPTAPWRGQLSLPRRVTLRRLGGRVHLVQAPVPELQLLRRRSWQLQRQALPSGTHPIEARGKTLELLAVLVVQQARAVGLKVRVGPNQETLIGYDMTAQQVFVDRTRSGRAHFHPRFATRHGAPLPLANGKLRLHMFVDWWSVEVFAGDGQVVFTELIFPNPESDGLALFVEGGGAFLESLHVWELASPWP